MTESSILKTGPVKRTWKSRYSKLLLCRGYIAQPADPARMETIKVEHEAIKLQTRIKTRTFYNWRLYGSDIPIQNNQCTGKIDDYYLNRDKMLVPHMFVVAEYVSSPYARLDKLVDCALSVILLREKGIDAGGVAFARDRSTPLTEPLIQSVTGMLENFTKLSGLDDEELLDHVNPASGLCYYCINKMCGQYNRMRNTNMYEQGKSDGIQRRLWS